MDDAPPIFFLTCLIALVGYIWIRHRRKQGILDTVKPLEVFEVGKYLTGLPHVTSRVELTCWVSASRFLFMTSGSDLADAIPRDAVIRVIVDKKSQITQRLTATRMLTLGVFALAAPKKNKNETFCLGIDWTAENGLVMSTIFEFEGVGAQRDANEACNTFHKYVASRPQAPHRAEVRCPYCAENILVEARVCKHCGREVATVSAGPKTLQ